MSPVRLIILALAAVAAIVLAFLVRGITSHRPAPPPVVQAAPKPTAKVLVAHRELAVGTKLAQGDLAWQSWPADAVNAAFITDGQVPEAAPKTAAAAVQKNAAAVAKATAAAVSGAGNPMDALYGSIVREKILANEPVTQAKLVRGGAGGYMAVVLGEGMRAVAVPVNVSTAAGGFILPGDHVDVLQSLPADSTSGHTGFVSKTLLRDVRVLAIDQNSQPPKNGQSMVGAVATLEVPADDAQNLARGKAQGEMVLALRPYVDADAKAGHSAAGKQELTAVRIFRGAQSTEVMVAP